MKQCLRKPILFFLFGTDCCLLHSVCISAPAFLQIFHFSFSFHKSRQFSITILQECGHSCKWHVPVWHGNYMTKRYAWMVINGNAIITIQACQTLSAVAVWILKMWMICTEAWWALWPLFLVLTCISDHVFCGLVFVIISYRTRK